MVDLILKQSSTAIHFDRVYETDMAEGLKAMALEGHGIAFLPFSAVKKDLCARRLVSAAPLDLKGLQITMDVRVYRERPSLKEGSKLGGHRGAPSAERAAKSTAQALWDYLLAQGHKDATDVVPLEVASVG
jgi:DNA-binding transcriptional LysR family regulator